MYGCLGRLLFKEKQAAAALLTWRTVRAMWFDGDTCHGWGSISLSCSLKSRILEGSLSSAASSRGREDETVRSLALVIWKVLKNRDVVTLLRQIIEILPDFHF